VIPLRGCTERRSLAKEPLAEENAEFGIAAEITKRMERNWGSLRSKTKNIQKKKSGEKGGISLFSG